MNEPTTGAERRAEGWIRRADWSPRTALLGPRDPSLWHERPFWIPSQQVCPAPRLRASFEPDGEVGDLWRCPDCGLLWQVVRNEPHSQTRRTWKLLGFWRQMTFRAGWWPR